MAGYGFGAKVKLTVDRSRKAEFNKQISDMVGQIKVSNKFTVLQKDMDRVRREAQAMLNSNPLTLKVNKIDCSAAVNDVKRQLQTMLSALSVSNGVNITGLKDFIGTDGMDAAMRNTADAANAAIAKMNEAQSATARLSGQMEVLNTIAKSVASTYKRGTSGSGMIADEAEVQRITAAYNTWIQKVREAQATRSGDIEALQREGLAIQRNITALQNKQTEERRAQAAAEKAARAAESAAERAAAANESEVASLKQVSSLQERMARFLRSNSRVSVSDFGTQIRTMLMELNSGSTITTERLREMEGVFVNIRSQALQTGVVGRTVFDSLRRAYEKFGGWMLITRSLTAAIHTIKNMISSVREIDGALTQLKIVTGATDEQLTAFLQNATALAKDLGQSIKDVLGSIETFSRLGYNLVDASELAEYATILSNVAAVDTAEATTGLTSIIKGYNMNVAEAEHVADVLVQVGQKYAVSASEMMEAYEKSGAALNAANTSFEKSAGLIAAANASVQNASTVGTALKTVSARIRGAKSDLEALGEETHDLAQGFSKYAEEIKALTGFDIMVEGTTDTYKDIYDIFEGIAKVWDKLSDTQQARVSEILGGTRQLQVISSILGNWKDAAGAYSDAMTSAGTATQANATYMESINGKIGTFNATFQELSTNIFSSGLVEFFVELGTAILSALNALAKINLLLPAIISMVVAINGIRAGLAAMRSATAAAETASTINTIVAKLVAEKTATDALAVSIANLTIAEKAELATKIQAAVVSGSLTAAQGEQILTTLGLAGAEGTLTGANVTLAASFKALMASIPVWGWIALGITAVITAVTALANGYKSSEERLAELNEEHNELIRSVRTAESEFRSLRDSADDVIPRFAELAKGVNQFGENVSLTDEEYQEFLSLNNRIAEMFPELNLGMDSNGNAMLALSYSADTLTDSLYALVEAQRQAAAAEIAEKIPEELENIKAAEKEYEKQIRRAKDVKDEWKDVYDDIVNQDLPTNIGRYSTLEAGQQAALDFIEKAQRLGMHGNVMVDDQRTTNNGYVFTVEWNYDAISLQNAKNALDSIIAGQDSVINNYENLINARWEGLNNIVSYWAETNFLYNDLNGQMRNIAKTMISGIDFASLGLDTEEKVHNYVEDYILRPLFLASPEVKTAFENLFDLQGSLKNGDITPEDFQEQVKQMFDGLYESVDADKQDDFVKAFVAGFNAMGIAGDDFNSVVEGIANNWGTVTGAMSGDNTLSNVSDLAEGISELQKAYSLLETAQKEMLNGGLSADTIASLADATDDYLDYLYEENGVVKLNTEAWKENANAKMQSSMADIQNEIDLLNERNAALAETLEVYQTNKHASAGDSSMTAVWDDKIREVNEEIEANTIAIGVNQAKLALYSALYGNITGDLDAYTAALRNFSNIASTIDSVSNSFQTLADLQAEVADGFTLSLDKALEFAKVYPEILNNAQVSADGQIILNQDVVNSFLQGKKAELDAQIDAQIAELEADKLVLQAKMEAAQAQLELAKNVGEGEGQVAKGVAEYRIRASNEMVQALIDNGIDEAEAFKLAAQAMSLNAEEFDRVAKEVCTDVDGNFNNAAYNAAMGIYENMERAKTDINSVTKQAHEAAKAVSGIGKGVVSGVVGKMLGSGGGKNRKGIETNVTSGEFNGFDYDFDFKGASLDDFITQVELDISSYEKAISQIDGQIAALKALKDLPLKTFESTGKNTSGSSPNASEVEEYIASIDEYREAIERLRKAQENVSNLETQIEDAGSYEKKIELQKQLIEAYKEEQAALHNLNNQRDSTIASSIDYLRELGFAVEYNADTNELWISNLEHLNELQADSKGKYKSMQEATNALRKETESLINSIEDLNEANREGSATWLEVRDRIYETMIAMHENAIKANENSITLTENRMDKAMDDGFIQGVSGYSNDIVSFYRQMQEAVHSEAEIYRAWGYAENSDEITKLSELWWQYEKDINDVRDRVVDNLLDMAKASSDLVDKMQDVDKTLHDAAEEYAANGGFISVDSLQAIYDLGPQYLQYLEDENGLLVINEDRINAVIAAKTEQLALDTAMSYVERLRLAALGESNENLDMLCFATTNATNATWGLVYAQLEQMRLAVELSDSQYNAALHNIQAIQSLAKNAIAGIGRTADSAKSSLEDLKKELEQMQDGVDGIIKYVMDMLKHRIQQQIDALNEMKKAYADIISLRKEALDAAKEEADYEDKVAEQIQKIAKLQERINALSLDDSRDAQAQKIKLEEEMSDLQKELADTQADYARDAQKDALDSMQEEYEKQKDDEIAVLEETISSYQKLYDMAISYINQNWRTLYQELIDWNYEYGSVLNSEITDAWAQCEAAAQRYGTSVQAMLAGLKAEIASVTSQLASISNGSYSIDGGGTNKPIVVSPSTGDTNVKNEDMVRAIVGRMKRLGAQWSTLNPKETNDKLHKQAAVEAAKLDQYGVHATFRGSDGTWWITRDDLNPSNVGRMLHNCYHEGGFVDEKIPLGRREVPAILEKGELVLDGPKQKGLYRMIDFTTALSEKLGAAFGSGGIASLLHTFKSGPDETHAPLPSVTNNQNEAIHFGDVYIYGANEDTAKQHREINRQFTNEVLANLHIKR